MRLRYIGPALLLAGAAALAQPSPQPQGGPPPAAQQQAEQQRQMEQMRQQMQQRMQQMRQQPQPQPRPPLERALGGPPGRWWDRPEMAQRLQLSADQQRKMDDVFQQSRLKMIDLRASLEKEELTTEPLVAAEQPDEAKILAQIDKVAQARAELEKANVRMLLGIRRVLTQDQWSKLKAETANNPPARGASGPGGPGR